MEGNATGGRKGKGEEREEVEGGIWPTQKFWRGAPYGQVQSTPVVHWDKHALCLNPH